MKNAKNQKILLNKSWFNEKRPLNQIERSFFPYFIHRSITQNARIVVQNSLYIRYNKKEQYFTL